MPTTGAGHRVENPQDLAINIISIIAPAYQEEMDVHTTQIGTLSSLAAQRNDEIITLRAEVDQLRNVVASVIGSLTNGDIAAALAALATV